MSFIERYRSDTLSAPNVTLLIGDPVLCRIHPGGHEFPATVVGVTTEAQPRYDVRDERGSLHLGLRIVRLDEAAMTRDMTREPS